MACCTDKIPPQTDWVIAKDVLEHVSEVTTAITRMMDAAKVGVFAVVPLADIDHMPYVVREYERDITHLHRLTLSTWFQLFDDPFWTVELAYRVPGIKDNYFKEGWERGNGFITARRQ